MAKASARAILANAFPLIVLGLWLGLVYLGLDGLQGVRAQHVVGYPNASQIGYYVAAPAVVAGILIVAIGALNFVKRSSAALTVVGLIGLFALPFYLLPYTGGV